ncbi:hypothetical protein DPMN_084604 [Dreissena polymorpha]|uniref:Uncharacterized protein n=1 Tax=Dreissena polymorpha TaxID=45954 RepID=A0A9D4BJE6_DREPO|nr:hypothetical protein DPMN_084604 [Dreissena polymorpha]
MNQFPKEELDTTLKDIDIYDVLPTQHSLGLSWALNLDVFTLTAPCVDRAFTRRGLLSIP